MLGIRGSLHVSGTNIIHEGWSARHLKEMQRGTKENIQRGNVITEGNNVNNKGWDEGINEKREIR
jgi:hypothetical protein